MVPISAELAIDARGRRAKFARPQCEMLRSLVVSWSPARLRYLAEAVEDAGWQPTVAEDVGIAVAHLRRWEFPLAVVDLRHESLPAEYRDLLEILTSTSRRLIIACGADGDEQEERWVRQLGVWMYLPGEVDTRGLTEISGEARQIVERIQLAQGVQWLPG